MSSLPWSQIRRRVAPADNAGTSLGFSIALVAILTATAPALAQPIPAGVGYLADNQDTDGSWPSTEVRRGQATTETLRALQAVGQAPAARSAAAGYLELEPIADTDDLSRRIGVLAAEGRDVTALIGVIAAAAADAGGWGLTPDFAADPLDTALALAAVGPGTAIGDAIGLPALSRLLSFQTTDGGWPCVDSEDPHPDIFCTSHAVLALASYRSRFFLDPEINAGVDFLRAQLNTDGSVGPAGDTQVIHTAMASLALAAVPAFGSEVATVIAFLESQQQTDGSWGADPYPTALAVRALQELAAVPFCGNGLLDQPGEACDGTNLGGLTCEDVGLGVGTLACSAQCTLDTSGCSAAPICGDNLRNQSFEVCDGTDLAAESCETLGFASGVLGCAGDCTSFEVSECVADAACGDGVINQSAEVCDLNDLDGATCESLGLGGGLLQCAADCSLDTSLCDAAGFDIDNKGREFFVGFMRNFDNRGAAAVHLTSDTATTVTVQYPAVSPSFVQNVAVNPGQVTIVPLPGSVRSGWGAGQVRNNAVRLSAAEEFVVYLVNRRPFSTDAGMALPVDALGTAHIVTTATASLVNTADRSQFLVAAPFDNTTVTITPTTLVWHGPSSSPPGVPYQVSLDRGEGYRGEAGFFATDLTGTLIESDRPVAVAYGNICTNIPGTTAFCDHIFEVAHPVRSWGTSALVANLPNRAGGSIYRVVASEDDTEVSLDGVLQTTIDRGELFQVGPLTGSHELSANLPIFVTQFMTGSRAAGASLGDPAMANMIPPDQYLEEYTFSTVGGGQFLNHYLTVITPDAAIGSLLLDGAPIASEDFSPIGSTGFSSALLSIPEGTHTTTSPEPHGITVEGINQDDSYIYPGGARIEFINQFCGDGDLNQVSEQCDGSDFGGLTCAAFGFTAGFLQCTAECAIDTSQCSGVGNEDEDEDGYPTTEDCDDLDPNVNPGMDEIPGNGVDDDCNPATPDEIPEAAVVCQLFADQISYDVTEVIDLEARVENLDEALSLNGMTITLEVTDGGGAGIFDESRDLAPLPPGALAQQNFVFAALGNAPGNYLAALTVTGGGQTLAECSAVFAIDSTAGTAVGLTGSLALDPELVDAGEPSDAFYSVQNLGNTALADLEIKVLLLDPDSGEIVGQLDDVASLDPNGGSYSASQPFSTAGLESNKTYLAVLIAVLAPDLEKTLDSARLTVVNAPPDCSQAFADPDQLWPPNHKLVTVGIGGVTDPDGDPVTVTVDGALQDEHPNDVGDGNTCPDVTGVGTSQVEVRRERSGQLDGRVYHLFFSAADGRGGTCEGEVTVCVPHDRRPGSTCGDQGALYDSTVCP